MQRDPSKKRIVVVGGGPAGMMAAIRAGQLNQDVFLLEKNSSLGRKLLLSGKGRCNVTNACDLNSFLKRFSGKAEFLRDCFKKFFNRQLIQFFEERGLELKIERQKRVFPISEGSGSILNILQKELISNQVRILCKSDVSSIGLRDKKIVSVTLNSGKTLLCDKIILATGGISYGFTGSTGDGLAIARKLGHKITVLRPGLVGMDIEQSWSRRLEGLTLKNIRISFNSEAKRIVSDIGELLFTRTGISGPLVLSLSSRITDWLISKKQVYAEIDLKPALSREQLDSRLLREFKASPRKSIRSVLKNLLPLRLIDLFLEIAKIIPDEKVGQITQAQRKRLLLLFKALHLDIKASRPIKEAMITCGGVSLKEIDPRTMASRLVNGLYFCGEMMDLDADTGGFNLQSAFSTGYLAGESASIS